MWESVWESVLQLAWDPLHDPQGGGSDGLLFSALVPPATHQNRCLLMMLLDGRVHLYCWHRRSPSPMFLRLMGQRGQCMRKICTLLGALDLDQGRLDLDLDQNGLNLDLNLDLCPLMLGGQLGGRGDYPERMDPDPTQLNVSAGISPLPCEWRQRSQPSPPVAHQLYGFGAMSN